MAPKSKVAAKGVVTPKNTARPTGLHLSVAQRKAYNATFTASAKQGFAQLALAQRRQAIQNAAQVLRNSRLQAAHSIMKKTAAAHSVARTAAIALFAVKQSFRQSQLAHQNAALRQRVFADYERHIQLAARAQFIYKGEKAYQHTAILATMTTAQAVSFETARFAAAAKTANKAATSVGKVQSSSPAAVNARLASQVILANAKAAALAAARATPAGKTAPRPAKLGPLCNPRRGNWFGNPDGYDCLAAAVANSMQRESGRPDDGDYAAFVKELGRDSQIADALAIVKWTFALGRKPALRDYQQDFAFSAPLPGAVIGFATENGPHAALYLGRGGILSWGEELVLSDIMLPGTGIEEAWNLAWADL